MNRIVFHLSRTLAAQPSADDEVDCVLAHDHGGGAGPAWRCRTRQRL